MLLSKALSPLLCALATLVLAAPVTASSDLKGLTGETFSTSIASGLWLVEYFSPYCPHCRHFEPTWRKLTEDFKGAEETSRFFMAQVNCITQGDLCQKNNIAHYPQMKLYMDGVEKETFSGDRTEEKITAYINENIKKYVASVAPPPSDQNVLSPRQKPNQDGSVIKLSASTFQSVLDDGPTFVKFYAPWCGHCKKLAPVWMDLAKRLKNVVNIAEVNCDDHSKLCRQEGVDGYPTLYLYSAGHKVDYRGARKLESMESYARKIVAAGLQSVDVSQFDALVQSEKVLYLYLRTISTSTYDINKVEEATRPLLGDPPVVQSQDLALWKRFDRDPGRGSVLLSIKQNEVSSSFNVEPTTPVQSIAQWLMENKLPLYDELTTDNFQAIMRADPPSLVVLVGLNTEDRKGELLKDDTRKLNDIAKAWHATGRKVKGHQVVFVWMDGVQWEKWLKNMYGMKLTSMPSVVVANHQTLRYYGATPDKLPISFDAASIHSTLDAIDKGLVRSKSSQNAIERVFTRIHNGFETVGAQFQDHPFRSVIFMAGVVALIVAALWKLVQLDVEPVKRERLD